ncbi:uncharacterized protein LOC116206449 [Punica granatum]|uniref:Uncharacterized protein LOC116206449 n=2 Tax=Punica granatum TaxID=22663 RepID=A0A6P8DLA1_PUNGR|nr:uncharacterized protein LOC116206449 [Punica granatum]PKI74843.1 hypothetical protein CRG98_004615 [Punica granatum]
MVPLGVCKSHYRSPFLSDVLDVQKLNKARSSSWRSSNQVVLRRKGLVVRGCTGENQQEEKKKLERRTFLTMEEAGLVEASGLSTHERFLCRLTISSLNLLRVIAEQEGCSIEELNAGRLCDWFLKDKLKREQDSDSSVLQWDDSEFQF